MKKIIIALILSVSLFGCIMENDAEYSGSTDAYGMIDYQVLHGDGSSVWIFTFYDRETGVMYICEGDGGLTMLRNADGTPKLYKAENNEGF